MKDKSNKLKRYSTEFKVESVARSKEIGTKKTSEELGIHVGTLNRWRNELANPSTNNATNGGSKPSYGELEKENRRLKREMGYVNEINRILKKSTAIFSSSEMGGLR